MSPPLPSRKLISQAYPGLPIGAGLTLADVLLAIDQADLSASRRRDMASAIHTVARLLDAEPAALPASPRLLAGRLDEIAPAAHGLSKGRWNNIRSLLRSGLALLGPIGAGRHLNALSPAWQVLWDRLDERGLKIGLSRVMRFCSAAGIAPEAVNVLVFEDFAASLEASLLKQPGLSVASARGAWNKAQEKVPGWPVVSWPKPLRRADHFCLPWSDFPASFRRDAEAWIAHLRGDDLMTATHRPLRPETLSGHLQQVRGFASALVLRGHDPAALRGLADLVALETVKEGLRHYLGRNGNRAASGVGNLSGMLLAIARHWVKVEPDHIAALQALATRLRPARGGMVEKNRMRLRAFDAPENVARLIHLPQRLLALAEAMPGKQRAAVLVQTALAIELLLVAPIRIKNLASIDLEQHISRPGRARGVVLLSFVRDEVKNGQVLDYPLPLTTVALLDRYLAEFRPLLAVAGSTALFPGKHGQAKGRMVLGPRISRTVFQYTGLRVNPHLFRHFAAKLQLEAEPGSYEVLRRVFGHTTIGTTTQAYSGTESAAAVRHYDKTLERLRVLPVAPRRRRGR